MLPTTCSYYTFGYPLYSYSFYGYYILTAKRIYNSEGFTAKSVYSYMFSYRLPSSVFKIFAGSCIKSFLQVFEMEVKSKKGTTHVIHEGYRYRPNEVNVTSKNWRCVVTKCKGTLTTPAEALEPAVQKGVHCHPPDPAEQEVYQARARIADIAQDQEKS